MFTGDFYFCFPFVVVYFFVRVSVLNSSLYIRAVTPFKEGPGSKINIYKRGIQAAKDNDDNVVLEELERLIEYLEIAEQKKADKLKKKKIKGVVRTKTRGRG